MTLSPKITATFLNHASFVVLAGLLLFAPLARGSVHGWAQAIIMAVAVVLAGLMIAERLLIGVPVRPKSVLDRPLLLLILILIGSAFFSRYRPDSVEAFALLACYAVIFSSTLNLLNSRERQRQIVYTLIAVAVVLATIGLLKQFSPLEMSWWSYSHEKGKNFMMSGSYGNHNHLAGYLEMTIPLVLGLFLVRSRRGTAFLLLLYVSLYLIAAQILTLSRGGWMSLALALTVMAVILLVQKRYKRKKMLLLIIGGVVFGLIITLTGSQIVERILSLTEEETVVGLNGRMIAWRGTWQMIADYPFWGTGPGTYATIFPQYQPVGMANRFFEAHNDYLQFVAEVGLLIIPAIFWLLFVLFVTASRNLANPSRQTWGITLGALSGFIAMLCHSIGDFNLHLPANAIVCTVLVALMIGRPKEPQSAPGGVAERANQA